MVHTVIGTDVPQVERIDALQAADVVSILFGVGAPLMMGMNAADGAEIVPRRVRVELVHAEMLGALGDVQSTQWHRRHDRASTPTIRAVAPSRADNPIGQIQQQLHSTTVARGAMLGLDHSVTDFFEVHGWDPDVQSWS
jgi:hypothetical protein